MDFVVKFPVKCRCNFLSIANEIVNNFADLAPHISPLLRFWILDLFRDRCRWMSFFWPMWKEI